MKLLWSRRARNDLDSIASYIATDDPMAARRWIEQQRNRARKAAAVPGIGRQVPEYARDEIREVLLRTYRIIYLVARGRVVVLAVVEGHHLLPSLGALG
jgi:plasmid stabilization system protein ParE